MESAVPSTVGFFWVGGVVSSKPTKWVQRKGGSALPVFAVHNDVPSSNCRFLGFESAKSVVGGKSTYTPIKAHALQDPAAAFLTSNQIPFPS